MKFGPRSLAPPAPVLVIAEAGVNHDGSPDTALELVAAAAAAGADAVKFQTFRADRLVARGVGRAAYQERQAPGDRDQRSMLARLELDATAHRRIFAQARRLGILAFSSPFDLESARLLADLGVPGFKIGSGELTNLPLLEAIARLGQPIILSTGMATLAEVDRAVDALERGGAPAIALLHCTSNYPADPATANLRAMATLATAYPGFPIGYSDHTPDDEIPLAAVALGARIIEKHFTLDRRRPGPDHAASLEPADFARMVTRIRRVEAALGTGRKRPAPDELDTRRVVRRWLVATRDLPAGHPLGPDDLTTKRADHPEAIAPEMAPAVIGIPLAQPVRCDQALTWAAFRSETVAGTPTSAATAARGAAARAGRRRKIGRPPG